MGPKYSSKVGSLVDILLLDICLPDIFLHDFYLLEVRKDVNA